MITVLNKGFFQMKSIWLQGSSDIRIFFEQTHQSLSEMVADYNGYWKMISNENFEEYLKALGEFYSIKILNLLLAYSSFGITLVFNTIV